MAGIIKVGLILLFNWIICLADYNVDVFNTANKLYDENKLDSVKVLYSGLLKNGDIYPEVYNNLGNIYFKQDSLSKAVYYYELAYKYSPYQKITINNLRNIYKNKFGEDFIDNDIYYVLRKFFNVKVYSFLFIMFLSLLFINLLLFFLKKQIKWKKRVVVMLINYIILIMIFMYSASAYYLERQFNFGVVVGPANIKNEPRFGKFIGLLHDGCRIKIVKSKNESYFINYNGKITGWIEKNKILNL